METVRREIRLPPNFDEATFDAAFRSFLELYHVPPTRIACSPDVLERFCALFEGDAAQAHRQATRPRYRGVMLLAAVLPPSTIAFEGEVCEERMGDW